MRSLVVVLLVFFGGFSQGQEPPVDQLLNRSYYKKHQPSFRPQGAESERLHAAYGTDFLPLGKRYKQVYNYALYYDWFFEYWQASFPDRAQYSQACEAHNEEAMQRYLQQKRGLILKLSATTPARSLP